MRVWRDWRIIQSKLEVEEKLLNFTAVSCDLRLVDDQFAHVLFLYLFYLFVQWNACLGIKKASRLKLSCKFFEATVARCVSSRQLLVVGLKQRRARIQLIRGSIYDARLARSRALSPLGAGLANLDVEIIRNMFVCFLFKSEDFTCQV